MLDRKRFKAGIDEYRPAVMWFWNDSIDEEEIRRQIGQFTERRIYQFFIHPLSGLEESYLSERFFELLGAAIRCAQEKGMKYWIYDEYNWPSGMAGGQLLRKYPQYRMLVLRYKSCVLGPAQRKSWPYEGRFIGAQALCRGVMRDVADEVVHDEQARSISWRNPEPAAVELYVFVEQQQGGVFAASQFSPESGNEEGYLDTMNPDAVRAYLELTHERYAASFGEHFGETIPGIFTDEVSLANPFDFGPDTIPWTSGFERLFREANGYDLLPRLAELVVEINDYRQTRYDFWRVLTGRFVEAYAVQAAKWCGDRGLMLTGHCSGEENMVADLLQSGSSFLSLQHYHVPGIDSIFSKTRIEDEDFNIAGKMITAVAEHSGAARTLCETYTGSGWDLSFREMKRIFHRLAVLGVNTIQFMGAYYSLRGMRKRLPTSYPPSHSFQQPSWKYYESFSDYISRLCYANSYGRHGAEIAVLMPTATYWCEYPLRHEFWKCLDDPRTRPYGDLVTVEATLCGSANALLQIQRDYDLIHEASLADAEVGDGVLLYRNHAYKALILPSLLAIKKELLDKVTAFAKAGGQVCFINMLPVYSPVIGDISEEIECLCGFSPAAVNAEVRERMKSEAPFSEVRKRNGVTLIVSNELPKNANKGLREALNKGLDGIQQPLALNGACEAIYMLHRYDEEAHVFILANDSSRDYSGTARIALEGDVHIYSPDTGAACRPAVNAGEGCMEFALELAAEQSLIVEIGLKAELDREESMANAACRREGIASAAGDRPEIFQEMNLEGDWVFEAGTNNLMRLDTEVAPANGAEGGEIQWRPAHDFAFPFGSGFELGAPYLARMSFHAKDIPSELELVMEPEEGEEILFNDVPLKPIRTETVWDPANRVYSLKGRVKSGRNVIIFKAKIPEWGAYHNPPFAVLRGSFLVNDERRLVKASNRIKVPGSWSDQGYPDYSGSAVYRREILLEAGEAPKRAELSIGNCRDIVEVYCNGEYAGTRLWHPLTFDLSGFLKEGRNILELKVINTLANLMEKPTASGVTGSVKLHLFYAADEVSIQ